MFLRIQHGFDHRKNNIGSFRGILQCCVFLFFFLFLFNGGESGGLTLIQFEKYECLSPFTAFFIFLFLYGGGGGRSGIIIFFIFFFTCVFKSPQNNLCEGGLNCKLLYSDK